MEQSLVGKVLSNWAIIPPMAGDFSTKWTKKPEFARSKAAWIPAMPPPATITEPTTPFPERAFSAHICNTPVKSYSWLRVLGYDYQDVIQTTQGHKLERRSIITQNTREEKNILCYL
jgi:hypothetical protein